jgi:nucleotide-binding universal stress UspA family protein
MSSKRKQERDDDILHIVAFVDGSEHSHHAFKRALHIKNEQDRLTVIHLVGKSSFLGMAPALGANMKGDRRVFSAADAELQKVSAKLLQFYIDELKALGTTNSEVVSLGPTDVKSAAVEWINAHNIDMVVVGCRGLGAIAKMFMGSFSEHVMRHADCDVVIVRSPENSGKKKKPKAEQGSY